MKLEDYVDGSWEHAAYKIAIRNEIVLDSEVTTPYHEMFDAGMLVPLARAAWNEIERGNPDWTLEDQIKLMAGKQHDYGHQNIMKYGRKGVEVRLWDKIARYNNLLRRGIDPENESLLDTLIDMVGYIIIWLMLANNTFTLPLAGDMR